MIPSNHSSPDMSVGHYKPQQHEIHVSTTYRPHRHSVRELADERSSFLLTVHSGRVDACVASIMVSIQDFKSDEIIMALTICFVMMSYRFQLVFYDIIGVVENFIKKELSEGIGLRAMNALLTFDFKDSLHRFEKIDLRDAMGLSVPGLASKKSNLGQKIDFNA